MNTIKTLGLAISVVCLTTITTRSAPIIGNIEFTGLYSQDDGTPGMLNTATSMGITSFGVGFADGDLAGAAPLSYLTPIQVNGGSLNGLQLWSVTVGADTYTFTVSSSAQSLTSVNQLKLEGTGLLSDGVGPKDETGGTWQLSFGRTGTDFTWQSTSNVPEGGSTLLLLGSALVGLLGIARKPIA